MESEWRESTWGEEVSLEYGKSLKGYRESTGRYRVYGSNGPVGWTDNPLAGGPGVILGRKGAYRGVEYSLNPFYVIDTAYYIKPKSEMDIRWLYYAVKYHKLGEIDDGSPIPSTTRAAVYVQDFSIPPLKEQKRIAHILGSLDDKIELNRQVNETLEAMAQALFKSWFVDFDPVIDNALAAGNETPEEFAQRAKVRQELGDKRKALPEDIRQLFPDEFVLTDEMGWIPKGWKVSEIGNEVAVVGGGTPSTKNPDFWEDGKFHWTTPKDLSNLNDKILLDTARKLTQTGVDKISSGLLPIDTVLLSSRAPVGYLALAKVPVAVNQGYIAMKCEKTLSSEYVIQWCESVMDDIKQRASGTTFAEISKKSFKPIPVLVPRESVIEVYSGIVQTQYSKVTANTQEIRTLIDQRDALLPKLLSGQLKHFEIEETSEVVTCV